LNEAELIIKNFFHTVVKEYRICKDRKWKFDYAIPEKMIAIEIEGAVWSNGRHTRGLGYTKDIEKYNRAILDGWKLIRFTYDHIKNGYMYDTLNTLQRIINL